MQAQKHADLSGSGAYQRLPTQQEGSRAASSASPEPGAGAGGRQVHSRAWAKRPWPTGEPPGGLGPWAAASGAPLNRQPWACGVLWGRLAPADWPLSVCLFLAARPRLCSLGPCKNEARVRRRRRVPLRLPLPLHRQALRDRAPRRASLGESGVGWSGTLLCPLRLLCQTPPQPPRLCCGWRDEGGTGVGGACEPRPCPMGASVSRGSPTVPGLSCTAQRHLLPLHRQIQV